MQNITQHIKGLLMGGVIGVANIIPGVSGGTMALVMGIYERLITAIHNISFETVKITLGLFTFKKENRQAFMNEFNRIDAPFLIILAIGAVCAIVPLAHIMKYLLDVQHDPTYGFFFGLVIASVYVPFRMIKNKKNIITIICALLAIGIIYGSDSIALQQKTNQIKKTEQTQHKSEQTINTTAQITSGYSATRIMFILLLGAVTISAMILPGISGSFLLLLLGGYNEVLQAVKDKNLTFIAIFGTGCLLGLVTFSRLLNYLLKHWHDQTMGFLTGLVIGSLWVIWPFKTVSPATKADGTQQFLNNIIPDSFSSNTGITILFLALGVIIVAGMIIVEKKQKQEARV